MCCLFLVGDLKMISILSNNSDFNLIFTLMFILGGLGIFLYGINLMGDSLKAAAGDKLKVLIEKSTNTPIKGILVGAAVTAVIQSSSGTTALAVGLVRAGLMSFPQAVGIIMGANIGTTVTSFIVGLNIGDNALWFVALGAIMVFFFKKDKIKQIGNIIFGFGLLFFGLNLMGENLGELLNYYNSEVQGVFEWLGNNPFGVVLGLFIGTGITAIVQSSSATIAIVQELYGAGRISLMAAIPILLGCNIGTTITAVFASFGGGTQAKRTAFVHTLFNVLGTLIFMMFIWAFVPLIEVIETNILLPLGAGKEMTLAVAHIIFNLSTTFILFFFINQMVTITNKLIKNKHEENIMEELLDYTLIDKSPVLALSFAKKAIDFMADKAKRYIDISFEYSFENIKELYEESEQIENDLDILDKRIHDYLNKLIITDMDEKTSMLLSKYLDQIKDFERIGDHCNNIINFFKVRYDEDMHLTKEGEQDLHQIYSVLLDMSNDTYNAVIKWSKYYAISGKVFEDEIDKLEQVFYKRHIHRVESGICTILNSEHYAEILSNVERMGDHLYNICESIEA